MHAFTRPLLVLILSVIAQVCYPYVLVKGRLASATDDTPLAGATLRLLTLPDSTLLIGTYSDKDGNFSIASSKVTAKSAKNPVKILLVASYMGYQTAEKVINVRPREKEYDLKDVYLQEDTRILGEALVSATPPPLLIKEDTIEYYADSYKTQPDATAEDLLKRLPGVEVNADGSITAQGETVQQVYVDGKEFFGNNVQATTKNITADMIESVQVVDMKTEEARLSGIDDGERRKVMNFKLKPKMRRGWFGNMAGAWGKGTDISDRFETRGMAGYFRGNSQNAIMANGNNTNNTGFGDLGDRVMSGSAMRGNRQSGNRGDGLNTSWSVGVNLGYDEGNRMRDANTPLGINGNILYGGSKQDEESKSHRINYMKRDSDGDAKVTSTVADSYNRGHNDSQNLQLGLRFEKSWGKIEESGQHRIQINPSFNFNQTETDDYSQSHTYRGNSNLEMNGNEDVNLQNYISQTVRRNEMKQRGGNFSISSTYSFVKRTSLGRRRSSITLSFSERKNDGDQFTRSYTTYDSLYQEFSRWMDISQIARTPGDTLINQWQEEDSHNESYRVRLTHIEPLGNRQTLELSATANLSEHSSTQLYHFWDGQQWTDSVNGRSSRDYSSETESRNVNYTLSASYRKVTDTYNFSAGMDFLPQSQQYTDYYDHSRDYKRHYINYSPRMEYRYNWTRRKNLRITLNGQTSQPSMSQLQARKNQTSATHVRLGNPDLDPSYSTNFSAQYRAFDDVTYSTIEARISARASFNNLVTKRWYSENLRTDTTQTVNLSGVGNWNVNGNFRGSWPFYDNLWYITSNTTFGYSESQGYASIKSTDAQLNTTRNYNGGEQAGIAYRGEKLNIEVRGNYNIQYAEASIATSGNLGTTHRFGVSGNMTARLPYDFTLSSDFHYTGRRGYSAALTRNQSIWNAQLSRTFLQKKNLSAFIKVFDILQQKSSITRNITATDMVDRETTVLSQYFLVGASIKFNRMGQRGGQRRRPNNDNEMPDFGGGGYGRGGNAMGGGNFRDEMF